MYYASLVPSWIRNTCYVFALGVAATGLVSAQSRESFGVACLSADQRADMAETFRKLILGVRLNEEIESLKQLLDQQQASSDLASDCKRRLENIFETLMATLEGCPGKIDQYNQTVQEINAKQESVRTRTEIVRTQIQLHRSKYPLC